MDVKVRQFQDNLTAATKESAEAMVQQYQDATEKVIKDMRDKLFGGTLNDAKFFDKEWEMANDKADQYLDTVESAFEKDKLRARYPEGFSTERSMDRTE